MRKPPIHKSFFNAFRGIFMMLRTERNFQIQTAALAANIFLIFYLKLSDIDTLLVLMASFAVLSAESFNTAIEKICDLTHPEFDTRVGFIKDVSAGAVILTVIAAFTVGLYVYWKYIFV